MILSKEICEFISWIELKVILVGASLIVATISSERSGTKSKSLKYQILLWDEEDKFDTTKFLNLTSKDSYIPIIDFPAVLSVI